MFRVYPTQVESLYYITRGDAACLFIQRKTGRGGGNKKVKYQGTCIIIINKRGKHSRKKEILQVPQEIFVQIIGKDGEPRAKSDSLEGGLLYFFSVRLVIVKNKLKKTKRKTRKSTLFRLVFSQQADCVLPACYALSTLSD